MAAGKVYSLCYSLTNYICLNAEHAGDGILTPNDVAKVAEQLLPAQSQSYELGLKLNLPPDEVKSIHTTYLEPRKRLLHVVIEFLNQEEPKPTWRLVVEALKSPEVNLPEFGKTMEEAHCLSTTSIPQVTGKSYILLILHFLLLCVFSPFY